MDRPVPGVDRKLLPAAVHLARDARRAEGALDGHRNAETDPPVVGAGFDVGAQVSRDGEVHAAVPGADVPAVGQPRAGAGARVDAAVSGLDVQGVEPAVHRDVSVAGSGLHAAVQIVPFDAAVAGAQTDFALGALDADVSVAGVDVQAAVEGLGFHRAVPGVHVEVGLPRHANLETQVPVVDADAPAPV